MQETWVWSLGQADPLERGIATHSHILAWEIPWTEEPGRLQSLGSLLRQDWVTHTHTHIHIGDLKCCINFRYTARWFSYTYSFSDSFPLNVIRRYWLYNSLSYRTGPCCLSILYIVVCILEKEMATHASILAWRIPGMEEPGGLPSMGSQSWTWLKRLSSSSSVYLLIPNSYFIYHSFSFGKNICFLWLWVYFISPWFINKFIFIIF